MKKGKETVAEKARAARSAGKTNHQTGYHKRIKNPSTNYIGDAHKAFCKRCFAHNKRCPLGRGQMSSCSL